MSTLTDRLRGMVAPTTSASVIRPAASPTDGGESVKRVLGAKRSGDGRSFVVERRVDATASHGRAIVGDLAVEVERAAGDASLLTGLTGLAGLNSLTGGAPARAPFVFFDLETTGLSGGAGTYAFLVGCAWFDDDGAFVMRQHLLVDYGVERSMLERVAADLDRAGALVSFNGKSFDAPLLETRYLFHRMEWTARRLPHVDVLHPARQFWRRGARKAEQSCSLAALETELLNVRRSGDVPGFEIPSRYFQFIRTGDARPLAAVLEHNRLDLLSLAGLTARLLQFVREGPDRARDEWEMLALGRVYARAGLDERARDAFERAADMCGPADDVAIASAKAEALRMLAVMLRRARRYDEAAVYWRRLFDLPACPPDLVREASEALAIHHEHRLRDLAAAKAFALRSLKGAIGDGMDARAGSAGSAWNDAVRHRLQRIERKLISGRPLFPSWPSPPPACGSPTSARRTSS